VSLAGGINILESGQTWLAKHLTGRRVWFKPLRITSDDRLECIVHTRMVSMSVPVLLSVCLCVCVCGNQIMYLSVSVGIRLCICLGLLPCLPVFMSAESLAKLWSILHFLGRRKCLRENKQFMNFYM